MDQPVSKFIVVSAVNIRKGGTLTILRSCLEHLSAEALAGRMRVVALVHDRSLADYPAIEYIEMPETIRSWGRRLRAEYHDMLRISRQLAANHGQIDLWLSLHDTTPCVEARRQAVYCQTSFPFMHTRWRDYSMDPKIPLFARLTQFVYRFGVGRNYKLIVQQRWLREGLSKMLGISPDRFIVAPPRQLTPPSGIAPRRFDRPTFLYAATADCHKNFEILAEATRLLEQRLGPNRFQTLITVSGNENRYARWLYKRYSSIGSLRFEGLMDRPTLFASYAGATCLVFPSRIETWGLPISEFMQTAPGSPMIISDLPYAHETAAGAPAVAFFPPDDASRLASLMQQVVCGNLQDFNPVDPLSDHDLLRDWDSIFQLLLKDL